MKIIYEDIIKKQYKKRSKWVVCGIRIRRVRRQSVIKEEGGGERKKKIMTKTEPFQWCSDVHMVRTHDEKLENINQNPGIQVQDEANTSDPAMSYEALA